MTSTPRRQSAFAIYSRQSTSKTETSTVDGNDPKRTVKRQMTKVVTRSANNRTPVTTTKKQVKRKNTKSLGNSKTKMVVRKLIAVKSDANVDRIFYDAETTDDDDDDESTSMTNDAENQIIDEDENNKSSSEEDSEDEVIISPIKKVRINGKGPSVKSPGPSVKSPVKRPAITKTVPCGTEAADTLFKWLINPISTDYFFKELFEKKPYHLKRNNHTFYKGIFDASDFKKIIKENYLNYAKHLDIVAYIDGERVPIENEMPVHPDFVWSQYMEGYSVRMRNPQAYNKGLWKVCSLLQEFFSSSVGANMYLTPANSQGFPPHYDDIDAFILQIEGKKHWNVYLPEGPHKTLPRFSSGDFKEHEIPYPYMETELLPGDLLYIPRGFTHQAVATDEHSLHITISTNQLNTWTDYFIKGFPKAVEIAAANNEELRKALPKDYYEHMGCSYAPNNGEQESPERKAFRKKSKQLSQYIASCFPDDDAADAHAMDFIHSCMPPYFSRKEAECSIHGHGHKFQNGVVKPAPILKPETKIRWIRRRAFRVVIDQNGIRLVNTLGNSKNTKEEDLMFMEVEAEVLPAVQFLCKMHPEFVAIKDLPISRLIDGKLAFAEGLYSIGYLVTEEPLE